LQDAAENDEGIDPSAFHHTPPRSAVIRDARARPRTADAGVVRELEQNVAASLVAGTHQETDDDPTRQRGG
jgi:hypothetical protein